MIYACSTEGVQALNQMANGIQQSVEEIKSKTASLSSMVNDAAGLGPHAASIQSALEEIKSAANRAIEPAEDISDMLKEVAEGYEDVIGMDRFGGGGK